MEDKWIPITLINQSKAESNCRFLSVTQATAGKLKMIRPGVYLDDPRLTFVKDLPEHKKPKEPECVISPEMKERAEASYRAYKENERKAATTCATIMTPEPQKPMTFEETLENDWRFNPGIRKEFVSQASYEAYMRAEKAGRVRVCGCG